MLAQSLYPERPTAIQLTFNVCAGSLSTALGYFVYHSPLVNELIGSRPLVLCLAASIYFIVNAGCIAVVISFSEGKPLRKILVDCYFWSFPYYLVGAGIRGCDLAGSITRSTGKLPCCSFLPFTSSTVPTACIWANWRMRSGMWKKLRTCISEPLRRLALAIEAKDQTTHDHLQRVRDLRH